LAQFAQGEERQMIRKCVAIAVGAALASSPAAGQQADFRDNGLVRAESRVMVGLVLPLGGQGSERAPQVELRMARGIVGANGQRLLGYDDSPFVSRIGLSLDGQDLFLVNGRLVQQDDRQGVSTLGGVAIGVGVLLVAGSLLVLDRVRDASE
jgi:hypothetical protein